jgi:hypothetical protein
MGRRGRAPLNLGVRPMDSSSLPQISASRIYLAKWVLPLATFVGVAAWQVFRNPAHSARNVWTTVIIPLCILGGFLIYFLKRDLWGLADAVLDGGEFLVVTYNKTTCQIRLADISKVEAEQRFNAATVTLILAKPCELGDRVRFLAKVSRGEFGPNSIARELAERVVQYRGRR